MYIDLSETIDDFASIKPRKIKIHLILSFTIWWNVLWLNYTVLYYIKNKPNTKGIPRNLAQGSKDLRYDSAAIFVLLLRAY